MSIESKILLMALFGIIIYPSIASACGWYSYEDIEGMRVYYNGYDRIEIIEDSKLQMTRFANTDEIRNNFYGYYTGWIIYEDIRATKIYYDRGIIKSINDSVLKMTRFPTPYEKQMNIYVPMNYGGNN